MSRDEYDALRLRPTFDLLLAKPDFDSYVIGRRRGETIEEYFDPGRSFD